MYNVDGGTSFFSRQITWIVIGVVLYLLLSRLDFRILRKTTVVVALSLLSIFALIMLLLFAEPIQGAQSWFVLGPFSFQPSDPIKLVVIILLAKYFSRRHIEIGNFKHIMVSGLYAGIFFFLILLQPDFGTAIIIASLWFLMVLISGINKNHLAAVFALGLGLLSIMWFGVFEDYQQQRILTFLYPRTDIQGAGYNAYQSRIAVGSGEFFGKGVGQGTQSKLNFLPEYETDFIFASFAEEWGFFGVVLIFILYLFLILYLLNFAWRAPTNFESLFALGVASLFLSHVVIHSGMNLGLLPVTGTTIPFMSYGGSHILTSYIAIGIVASMRRYRLGAHREALSG